MPLPNTTLLPSPTLLPELPAFDALERLIVRLRELPPLRLHIDAEAPSGRHFRWGEDDTDAANVPTALRHSSTMPGGYESLDVSLPRKPGVDYSDLDRLSTLRVIGAGGDIAGEYRLERTPRVSGDQMAISPSAVGWQAHLDDDKSARMIYVDRDVTQWRGPSTARQLQLATGGAPQGNIQPSIDNGSIVWNIPANQALLSADSAEVFYDIGPGLNIIRVQYRGSRTGAFTSFEATNLFADASDSLGSPTTIALTLDSAIRTATGFADTDRIAMMRVRTTANVTPPAGYQQLFDFLGVWGPHHALPVATDEGHGVLGSDVVIDAVGRWAPLLTVSEESVIASTFVIEHLSFPDSTTAGAIVREATKYGLQDWAVWDNKTFWWYGRGTMGRKWRARISPAQLEETGPQVDRLWNSVMVQYNDVDGSTRTVGPVGSGADTENDVLADTDPDNPATVLGIIRRQLLTMGTGTVASATEVGRRFLEESKTLDRSGQARLVGHVMDDRGTLHPYWRVRAGDTISFVDASDTSARRIVRADHDRASRTCTVDLDAPPEGLAALLERLGVVLVPLGIS